MFCSVAGYTLGMWLKFDEVYDQKGVYLSNGGERTNSHGVAMMYENGRIEWVFRMQSGREWRVTYDNVLERLWNYVMVTWIERTGLVLYVNGEKVSQDAIPAFK